VFCYQIKKFLFSGQLELQTGKKETFAEKLFHYSLNFFSKNSLEMMLPSLILQTALGHLLAEQSMTDMEVVW